MRSVPIHDASVPIACTAGAEELVHRLEQVERMRRSLVGIERTEHGMLLRFPNRADLEADLRDFVVAEKACCQFWGFDITAAEDELQLRWDAPPSVADQVDRLVAYLTGDVPISDLSGLL
jgi:hypothetical protein